jgi:hypothetical protein
MNSVHGLICSSRWWARTVERELLPWALEGVDLTCSDSLGTGAGFRVLHVRDTLVRVDPTELPERLGAAGLVGAQAQPGGRSFRFRARKPGAGGAQRATG